MNYKLKESVLITGGAGFIGTHLCRALIGEGHRVTSLDLKTHPSDPVEGVQYLIGDARDLNLLHDTLKEHCISVVYHLAATVSVPLCQKDVLESYSNNVTATLTVLEACRLNPVPVRFAFASSAALYGSLGDNQKPLPEEQVSDRFMSFYAAQKHASEKMIELYQSFHQIPSLIFRFFNVYGKGQDPKSPYSGVITIFAERAKNNLPLTLFNSGIQTRDFIPVTEIAKALTTALELPPAKWDSSVINLGTGSPISVRDLAEIILNITGSESQLVDAPPREGDVVHSLAKIDRAKALLDFDPQADLEQELSKTTIQVAQTI